LFAIILLFGAWYQSHADKQRDVILQEIKQLKLDVAALKRVAAPRHTEDDSQ